MAPIVGIILDPYSARDLALGNRRASGLQIADPTNDVLRVLAGLCLCGIAEVVMMPDGDALVQRVKRELSSARRRGVSGYPDLTVLAEPNRGVADDNIVTAALMRARNVGFIVIIVDDGDKNISVTPRARASDVADAALEARRELEEALRAHHWNVSAVANLLSLSRSTVHRRIQRFGLVRPQKRKFQ